MFDAISEIVQWIVIIYILKPEWFNRKSSDQ